MKKYDYNIIKYIVVYVRGAPYKYAFGSPEQQELWLNLILDELERKGVQKRFIEIVCKIAKLNN